MSIEFLVQALHSSRHLKDQVYSLLSDNTHSLLDGGMYLGARYIGEGIGKIQNFIDPGKLDVNSLDYSPVLSVISKTSEFIGKYKSGLAVTSVLLGEAIGELTDLAQHLLYNIQHSTNYAETLFNASFAVVPYGIEKIVPPIIKHFKQKKIDSIPQEEGI